MAAADAYISPRRAEDAARRINFRQETQSRMRAEPQALKDDIEQSVGLLRRHL
jgi:hypothetical protein